MEGHDRKNKKLVFIISKGQRIAKTSERAKMQKRQKHRKKKKKKRMKEREKEETEEEEEMEMQAHGLPASHRG